MCDRDFLENENCMLIVGIYTPKTYIFIAIMIKAKATRRKKALIVLWLGANVKW